ncbi:MAG TPA: hypothetical protein VFZ76_18680 [Anaerolineales bacterium]
MTPRTARWIGRFLFVAYVILATVGLTLQAMTDTPYINTELPVLIILVILVGVWIVTGTLIISRHPHHPVGWLLCVGLFSPAIDMRAGSPFPRVYGTLTLALGSAVIELTLALTHPAILNLGFRLANILAAVPGGALVLIMLIGVAGLMRSSAVGHGGLGKIGLSITLLSFPSLSGCTQF